MTLEECYGWESEFDSRVNEIDLRIDDWVKCPNGEIGQVMSIDIYTKIAQVWCSINQKWCGRIEKLRAIPLADEVLEVCGFKKHDVVRSLCDDGVNFYTAESYYRTFISTEQYSVYLRQTGDCEFAIEEEIESENYKNVVPCTIHCGSLHQLQNVYYALSGTYLDIQINKLKELLE